jgi:Uma2 family endonuclease
MHRCGFGATVTWAVNRRTFFEMTPPTTMTANELQRLNLPDKRTELVRGVLVVREPAGYGHGAVAARLAKALMDHVDRDDLGHVLAAVTGFKLASNPDTVRAPDVAFVRRERIPNPVPSGFAALAPDLVVEVLSPDDRPGAVLAKVADWLTAGCALVWVVDPIRRLAHVYRADGREQVVHAGGALDGEGVLPGFACPLLPIRRTDRGSSTGCSRAGARVTSPGFWRSSTTGHTTCPPAPGGGSSGIPW